MSYGPGRSRLLTGTLVGFGVWIAGFLFAVALVAVTEVPGEFSLLEFAASIYVAGTTIALYLLVGMDVPLVWVLPSVVGLVLAVVGGAVVTARTDASAAAWPAVKTGATVTIGIFLLTMTILAVHLVPETEFATLPLDVRYVILVFGNLLLPALFGALGGAIQHTLGGEFLQP